MNLKALQLQKGCSCLIFRSAELTMYKHITSGFTAIIALFNELYKYSLIKFQNRKLGDNFHFVKISNQTAKIGDQTNPTRG